MNEQLKQTVETATAVALATNGSHDLNLIPISVVTVQAGEILLYDFFMNKTVENLRENPNVVLTCWSGFEGMQIKATAVYQTEGDEFIDATQVMKERFPDRTLKAVIRLTPTAAYNVAPGTRGEQISL